MSDDPDVPRSSPAPEEDYGYDLAHDGTSRSDAARSRGTDGEPPHHVYGGTQTEDPGGDYGYDLAHDVPPQRPAGARRSR